MIKLFKAEYRIIELWFHSFYLYFTTNNTQHTYQHFLQLPNLLQTKYNYNTDIIETCWKEFLLKTPTVPTETEMLLAMTYNSKYFKCSTKMFNPFYKLKGKDRRARLLTFKTIKVDLTPKIQNIEFHQNVYLFMCELKNLFSGLTKILI